MRRFLILNSFSASYYLYYPYNPYYPYSRYALTTLRVQISHPKRHRLTNPSLFVVMLIPQHFVLFLFNSTLRKFIYEMGYQTKKTCKICRRYQHNKKKEQYLYCSERKERDSNPRSLSAHRFSRPAHSTTLPSFRGQRYNLFSILQNF